MQHRANEPPIHPISCPRHPVPLISPLFFQVCEASAPIKWCKKKRGWMTLSLAVDSARFHQNPTYAALRFYFSFYFLTSLLRRSPWFTPLVSHATSLYVNPQSDNWLSPCLRGCNCTFNCPWNNGAIAPLADWLALLLTRASLRRRRRCRRPHIRAPRRGGAATFRQGQKKKNLVHCSFWKLLLRSVFMPFNEK